MGDFIFGVCVGLACGAVYTLVYFWKAIRKAPEQKE